MRVSFGHILSGYLGLFCLASAVVAIGTWGSSISRTQYVAGAVSSVVVVLLLLTWLLGRIADAPLDDILSYCSLFDKHFQPFMRGRVNTQSIIYYGSLTFAFLLLSVRSIRGRRWR